MSGTTTADPASEAKPGATSGSPAPPDFTSWIGRVETTTDVAEPGTYRRLADLLDHAQPNWDSTRAPPLGHWLNFLPRARQSELGEDGHPRVGGFLPPVPLPRRMWAGSRIEYLQPIPVGAAIERRSCIQSIQSKRGKSGDMIFVTVRHEVSVNGALARSEAQDLVYRAAAGVNTGLPQQAASLPVHSDWRRRVTPTPQLLFRYSALTFNSHRIHYDREFCTTVEGYPDLVVQGPLIATLLIDHCLGRHRPDDIMRFTFRAVCPLFRGEDFDLVGIEDEDGVDLFALRADGVVATRARVDRAS
jgi:3-methylfumaryl-CoA hydratase